jgi:colanic acid/amylovoran biosynthesis glycosyltransferase
MLRDLSRPLRIISVGSLVRKKGHHDLIASCRVLANEGVQFTCTIVGDGPERVTLQAQIQRLGLQEHVHLAGALIQARVFDALDEHDLFVLASVVTSNGNRDGIPVALMEAAHSALPIVSTNVSGIPELIRHHETGMLVQPGCPGMLAETIMTLAAKPALCSMLGANAQLCVAQSFSIAKSVDQLSNVFLQIAWPKLAPRDLSASITAS